ncbi:D-xylose 1-dehydrogenase (NADP(+)) [Penicillium nucicola]|uniref:D-xylose 1-dehydrogenase (NADP(+)) n=1 Tax=Penicillium nucicola TaxID=1850975 RepID=UPI0025455BCC|nr:D-xylose 1-dehydrogenase (NADP(+)) [Penicillium nucicola]KAJ5747760.1 D-xylose 1-dehydrogenase (NADP(+)) [Penicillium nucicola]
MAENTKTVRWGIIGCGWISSWFVSDLVLERPDSSVKHVVQAIGSSSLTKASEFVETNCPQSSPTLFDKYEDVYQDENVDIVYIGTPHSMHFEIALNAINARKNVLCEKPLTMNANQARILIEASRKMGVLLVEAVWTRFFPIITELQSLLHEQKVIGDISRVFVDFGLEMPLSKLPSTSRTADPTLGAGALLDIGIYTLTWADLILEGCLPEPETRQEPEVLSSMSFCNGADEMTSIIMNHLDLNIQVICTSSYRYRTAEEFCRIEGSDGSISVGGIAASKPEFLVIKKTGQVDTKRTFKTLGKGFCYEQDSVGHDVLAGRTESSVVTLKKTEKMMMLMDNIRFANGLRYIPDGEGAH